MFFFLVFSYGISTTLRQIFISLPLPIHPSKDVNWCPKKDSEYSEATDHWLFEKKLTNKTSRVYSFLGKLADFPGSF